MIDKRKFYINGAWINPIIKNDFEIINPSNEKSYAIISLSIYQESITWKVHGKSPASIFNIQSKFCRPNLKFPTIHLLDCRLQKHHKKCI